MNRYATLAVGMLCFGLILIAAGVGYGTQGVKVASGASSCGNGFSYSGANADLTDTGDDACAAAQSARQATTWGLMVGGIIAVVLAGIVAAAGGAKAFEPVVKAPQGEEAPAGPFA